MADGAATIAFHPHHLALAAQTQASPKLIAKTQISEITGSESFVHVDFNGVRWVMLAHGIHDIDPDTEIAEIRSNLDSEAVEPLLVELDGRPIAYLQSYDPHLEDDHPYQDQPFGTLGIDLTIGPAELLGAGHGSAIVRQFSDELFAEGAPRVIIDPDPRNARAIRAYEKAGFRPIGERTSIHGHALLMARDAEEAEG